MANVVSLRAAGVDYVGWQGVRVTRGIESIAGSFELTVSERWANEGQAWPINNGDECAVSIGDETVITGYVDGRKPSVSPSAHTLTIKGRDRAADLVDCSSEQIGEFNNVDVYKMAKELCKPFGIKASLQPGLTFAAVKKLSVDPGDTVFNTIEHMCRLAGVLPISSGDGEIILTRAGDDRAVTDLVEGENLKSFDGDFDMSNRFSKYVLLGQHVTSPGFFGDEAAHVKATATDPNVTRYRPMIVRPEGNVTPEYAKRRVQWEATVRAARSDTITCVVQGWTMGNSKLWPINALVHLKSPRLRVDGDMLITQAQYEANDSVGRITTLTLRRPDAFKPEPQVQSDGLWKEISKGV